jgi:hypothetical protein
MNRHAELPLGQRCFGQLLATVVAPLCLRQHRLPVPRCVAAATAARLTCEPLALRHCPRYVVICIDCGGGLPWPPPLLPVLALKGRGCSEMCKVVMNSNGCLLVLVSEKSSCREVSQCYLMNIRYGNWMNMESNSVCGWHSLNHSVQLWQSISETI